MRQIKEVLRLAAQGLGNAQIARSLGLGKTTVSGYRKRARQAGVGWPLPDGLDDEGLDRGLFRAQEVPPSRPEPDWLEVHRELKGKKHVTLQLLWIEYRQDHPDGWAYTQFCVHYRRWLGRQDVVMRLTYAGGERMFVDYAGDTLPIIDPGTGESWNAQIFVAVLGASGMLYVEALRGQDLEAWLSVHARCFEAYGGVAKIIVPDNLKSGVTKACWYEPTVNASYLDLAQHFGTVILPARPHHPRDKAMVEAGVQVVERWVLAALRNRRFFSLAEANEAIFELTEQVNGRPFRGQQLSRQDLFKDVERPALQPLPPTRWEFARWKAATVNLDYHVDYERHHYSVPYQLVRESVEVRATETTVEILHRGRRVASHHRSRVRGGYTTDPAHMPASHRAHLEWTPSRLERWAAAVGPKAGMLVKAILESRPHPEHGYRSCLGLMRLGDTYGGERLDAACARALAIGSRSYGSVASILKNGLDQVPVNGTQPVLMVLQQHENLRGPEYYRETV